MSVGLLRCTGQAVLSQAVLFPLSFQILFKLLNVSVTVALKWNFAQSAKMLTTHK